MTPLLQTFILPYFSLYVLLHTFILCECTFDHFDGG